MNDAVRCVCTSVADVTRIADPRLLLRFHRHLCLHKSASPTTTSLSLPPFSRRGSFPLIMLFIRILLRRNTRRAIPKQNLILRRSTPTISSGTPTTLPRSAITVTTADVMFWHRRNSSRSRRNSALYLVISLIHGNRAEIMVVGDDVDADCLIAAVI